MELSGRVLSTGEVLCLIPTLPKKGKREEEGSGREKGRGEGKRKRWTGGVETPQYSFSSG